MEIQKQKEKKEKKEKEGEVPDGVATRHKQSLLIVSFPKKEKNVSFVS